MSTLRRLNDRQIDAMGEGRRQCSFEYPQGNRLITAEEVTGQISSPKTRLQSAKYLPVPPITIKHVLRIENKNKRCEPTRATLDLP